MHERRMENRKKADVTDSVNPFSFKAKNEENSHLPIGK